MEYVKEPANAVYQSGAKIHFCRWIFIFQMESQRYLMEEFICMAQRMSLTASIAAISFMYIQHLYQI